MSEISLEPGVFALPEAIQTTEAPAPEATDEEKARQLPDPTGWKVVQDPRGLTRA